MGLIQLVWRVLRVTWRLVRFMIGVVLVALEAVFWIVAVAFGAGLTAKDLGKAILSWRGGILHCPRGHEIPTCGQTYECTACGFVWESGSILKCPNPECPSPVTPYVNCPEGGCGLSVRNPWRWGRP